jgi:hypothetical protein
MPRTIGQTAAVLCIVLLLSGCGKSTPETNQQQSQEFLTAITFWWHTSGNAMEHERFYRDSVHEFLGIITNRGQPNEKVRAAQAALKNWITFVEAKIDLWQQARDYSLQHPTDKAAHEAWDEANRNQMDAFSGFALNMSLYRDSHFDQISIAPQESGAK